MGAVYSTLETAFDVVAKPQSTLDSPLENAAFSSNVILLYDWVVLSGGSSRDVIISNTLVNLGGLAGLYILKETKFVRGLGQGVKSIPFLGSKDVPDWLAAYGGLNVAALLSIIPRALNGPGEKVTKGFKTQLGRIGGDSVLLGPIGALIKNRIVTPKVVAAIKKGAKTKNMLFFELKGDIQAGREFKGGVVTYVTEINGTTNKVNMLSFPKMPSFIIQIIKDKDIEKILLWLLKRDQKSLDNFLITVYKTETMNSEKKDAVGGVEMVYLGFDVILSKFMEYGKKLGYIPAGTYGIDINGRKEVFTMPNFPIAKGISQLPEQTYRFEMQSILEIIIKKLGV